METYLDSISRDKLKNLCKVGRLYEAERLLDQKGTARLRKTKKWTPLFVAVDRGFHSLVELLLRYDHVQWDLEKAYGGAIRRRRNDLAGRILRSSWWSADIDPVEALKTGDIELVCSLKASGTDFTKPPIVKEAAMVSARGTIECLRAAKISIEVVEDQLYEALIHHAGQGHLKSLVHLLKAGLNPHRQVAYYPGGEDDTMSAVNAAIHSRKPAIVRMLKPSPEKDDPERLMGSAVFMGDRRILDVLLEVGFPLNCQKNGGSPVLHDVLHEAGLFQIRPDFRSSRPYDWSKFRATVEWLMGLGARWAGRDRDDYRHIRDSLVGMGEAGSKEIIGMMLDAKAITEIQLREILKTPRMRPIAQALGR